LSFLEVFVARNLESRFSVFKAEDQTNTHAIAPENTRTQAWVFSGGRDFCYAIGHGPLRVFSGVRQT
jgi:hypothetical protein